MRNRIGSELFFAVFLGLVLTSLTSCKTSDTTTVPNDDGSDSETSGSVTPGSVTPDSDASAAPVTSSFNGGLTGRLVTTYGQQPYEYSLSTGVATPLPIQTTKEALDSMGMGENVRHWNFFSANNSPSATQYVETVYDCNIDGPGICYSVFDENYQLIKRTRFDDRRSEVPMKLSRSGKYVLFTEYSYFDNDRATLWMVDSATAVAAHSWNLDYRIDSRLMRYADHPVVDWGANDQLVYAVPADIAPTVYVTEPGTFDIKQRLTLPDQLNNGYISKLDVHPDGKQVLIQYNSRLTERFSILLVLNLETLGIRYPIVDEADLDRVPMDRNFVSHFGQPMWSPDGEWILFSNGSDFLAAEVPSNQEVGAKLIAIPADVSRAVVNQPYDPVLAPAVELWFANVAQDGRLTTYWRGDRMKDGGHWAWVP